MISRNPWYNTYEYIYYIYLLYIYYCIQNIETHLWTGFHNRSKLNKNKNLKRTLYKRNEMNLKAPPGLN